MHILIMVVNIASQNMGSSRRSVLGSRQTQSTFYAKAAPGYKQVAPTGQFQSPPFDKIEKAYPIPMID